MTGARQHMRRRDFLGTAAAAMAASGAQLRAAEPGLNPAKGVGWRAFVTVVERIRRHLRDRVVWLRPSEITQRYRAAGGWGFLETL